MKAITLTQPYATLIAIQAKHIETRGWDTKHRGWLAIHAGMNMSPVGGERGLRTLLRLNDAICHALRDAHPGLSNDDICTALPRGAVIAVATLVDVVRLTDASPYRYERAVGERAVTWELSKDEVAMGDYRMGRYLWLLADVYPLVRPAWVKGRQGLWNWEATT